MTEHGPAQAQVIFPVMRYLQTDSIDEQRHDVAAGKPEKGGLLGAMVAGTKTSSESFAQRVLIDRLIFLRCTACAKRCPLSSPLLPWGLPLFEFYHHQPGVLVLV